MEKRAQKLLGVTIDKNLKFKEHLLKQRKKEGKKLSVLGRVCHILNLERRRSLMKAFIESQFGYCPLVWMFCGRQENNRINHLHERALRIVYNDYKSTFENLLELDNSESIHHKTFRLLSIELYKVKHNLSNQVMSELFDIRISTTTFVHKQILNYDHYIQLLMVYGLENILLQRSGTSRQLTLEILIVTISEIQNLLLKQSPGSL